MILWWQKTVVRWKQHYRLQTGTVEYDAVLTAPVFQTNEVWSWEEWRWEKQHETGRSVSNRIAMSRKQSLEVPLKLHRKDFKPWVLLREETTFRRTGHLSSL